MLLLACASFVVVESCTCLVPRWLIVCVKFSIRWIDCFCLCMCRCCTWQVLVVFSYVATIWCRVCWLYVFSLAFGGHRVRVCSW